MRVLVIPEDFRRDQYILKPLFKRLFSDMGKGNARNRVCQDPLLGESTFDICPNARNSRKQ